MLKRRNFIKNLGLSGTGLLLASRTLSMPVSAPAAGNKLLRFGVISDLHHLQFGKSEEPRLKSFMDAV